MRKFTLLLTSVLIGLTMSAQSLIRINFEDNTTNSAAVVSAHGTGSVSVVSNPVTTGINSSSYCLEVNNTNYAPVEFPTFSIPTGTASAYPYWKLRFKVAYIGINGGSLSDMNYPAVSVYSSAASPTLGSEELLGSISNVWGTATASGDSGVWKTAEFLLSSSALATIPNGILVLKLAKSKCLYLLDDIELIPSLTNGTGFTTLVDFEGATIGDATTYPAANIYGGTVSGTSTVAANPSSTAASTTLPLGNTSSECLQVSPTNYNLVGSMNISLSGNINAYDFIYFDRYFASLSYNQLYVSLGGNVLYKENSNKYPSIASGWYTEAWGIPSTATGSGSVSLWIGYTNMNSGSYYLDNIKIHTKSVSTGINETKSTILAIYAQGDDFHINQVVDKAALYDMNGRQLIEQENTNTISALGLPHGIYVIKSLLNNQIYINKVVK